MSFALDGKSEIDVYFEYHENSDAKYILGRMCELIDE
jgi:hypothetical protein